MNWLANLNAQAGSLGKDDKETGALDPRTALDVVTKLSDGNRILAQLVQTLQNLSPTATGTFTMDAAASKTITNGAVAMSSFVMLWPANASAGTLVGAGVYWTAADGSFTVTKSSGAAAGTETFNFAVWTTL